jgi:hypothetical protein
MKHKTKIIPTLLAAALYAGVGGLAEAQGITGSIGFGSLGVTVDSSDLSTATTFSLTSPTVSNGTGDYASVPVSTAVTFGGFTFNPPVSSVTPLWSFSIGSVNYEFLATSVTATFNSTSRQWDIGGTGLAEITGFTPTAGIWDLNLSQSGGSIVFDSTAATNVPEPSAAMLLCFGGVLTSATTFVRRLKA